MDKHQALLELAIKRKQTTYRDYKRLSDYKDGKYECDIYVSPYTKGAHNVNADIFVLLLDWASDKQMKKELTHEEEAEELQFGRTLNQKTNINLENLLRDYFKCQIADTYATNLFPYIKSGDIPDKDLRWAAKKFALPQIAIVQPKLVICCGLDTFNAVRVAAGHKEVDNVEEGINAPFPYNGSQIWLQSHPGWMGQSNRKRYSGNADQVNDDWEKMAASFPGLCSEQ